MDINQKQDKSNQEIAKLIEDKKYDIAEKELLKIIDKKEENYQTHFLLGNIYALLKHQEKAIKHLNLSINLNPTNKVSHYNLGIMLNELGQLQDAKKSFEEALKLDPEYLYANFALAISFDKENDLKKARYFYEKTLSINNDFILGHEKYAKFLQRTGDITKCQYHTYKYAGVIRFNDKNDNIKKIKRDDSLKGTNFIGCWNINNDELCKKIIDFFEKRKDLQIVGEIGYGKDENVKKSIDISIHPRDLGQKGFEDIKLYFQFLQECYQDYKMEWPFIKNNLNNLHIPSFNIQKYEIGGHFNKMHCERASLQSTHRVFAWMTYLNDVEDGGETYFEHYNLRVKPSTGKTLIWPAEWTHAHRGEILNKGKKYIVTGWMHFPFNFNN